MRRSNSDTRYGSLSLILAVCALVAWPPSGRADAAAVSSGPEFVPNQIIVKFRSDVAEHAPRALRRGFQALSGDPEAASLDRLVTRHRVKGMRRVFRSFEDRHGRLRETARQRVEKVRERRARKGQRLAPTRQVPALENIYVLNLEDGADVLQAVSEFASDPRVEFAQPNFVHHLDAEPLPDPPLGDNLYVPNDPYISQDGQNWSEGAWGQDFPDLYGLRNIRALEAWDLFDENDDGAIGDGEMQPGEGVVVAVVDSGIDIGHPDLAGNIWVNPGRDVDENGVIDPDETEDLNGNGIVDASDYDGVDNDENGFIDDVAGFDFFANRGEIIDVQGHGTHVAGTIAAVANNAIGIAGVAPGAKLLSARAFDAHGDGTTTSIPAAVRYAADYADIISNSWGGPDDPVVALAFEYAWAAGALATASAGNDHHEDVQKHFPSNLPTVLAVASVDSDDVLADSSNVGYLIDVSAPGVQVLSLNAYGGDNNIAIANPSSVLDTDYLRLNGTSMACPHVSGAAALLMSLEPTAAAQAIWGRLRAGAEPIDDLNLELAGRIGTGRLDLLGSIDATPAPDIVIQHVTVSAARPGAQVTIAVTLRNLWQASPGVSGTLTSTDPRITIDDGNGDFGPIESAETVSNAADPLRLTVSETASFGDVIPVSLEITPMEGSSVSRELSIPLSFFSDITDSAGVPRNGSYPYNAFLEDYDGDGSADLRLDDRLGNRWYRGHGDGTFTESNDEVGIPADRSGRDTLLVDIDNDGDKDILASAINLDPANPKPLLVLLNDGDGTTTDIGAVSGLPEKNLANMTAFDFDGDGWSDIIGASFDFAIDPETSALYMPLHLLHNNGDLTFTDVTEASGLAAVRLFGNPTFGHILAFDYDRDDDTDLLMVPLSSDIALWRNNGDGTFSDVTSVAFISRQVTGANSVATGDVDGDGDVDVFMTGVSDGGSWGNRLFISVAPGYYVDGTAGSGDLATTDLVGGAAGSEFFDYDNDGDLDLLVTASTLRTELGPYVFQNQGDGVFTRVEPAGVSPDFGARAGTTAIGDIDGDGALDVYAPDETHYSGIDPGGLLRSNLAGVNNWIKVDLEGTLSARDAFGATITLRAGSILLSRQLRTWAQDTSLVHFGVGQAESVDEIAIHWPSGVFQRLSDVAVNRIVVVQESAVQCPGGDDAEGDGVCDVVDNCLAVQNADQVDSNGDGFGNACDPDYDNDGIVDGQDFLIFGDAFGSAPGDPNYNADCDHDGVAGIGVGDYSVFSNYSGGPPGPSGLSCAGTIPCAPAVCTTGPDGDADGICDGVDVCTEAFDPAQIDTDQDGYGNVCDADYDNNGAVGVSDKSINDQAYGSRVGDPNYDPDVDVDSDGEIGAVDREFLLDSFGQPPGPSGLGCAGTIPCTP